MDEREADLYLAGHDHNMQHIYTNVTSSFDMIVNGGGGRGLYEYSRVNERSVSARALLVMKLTIVSDIVSIYIFKSLFYLVLLQILVKLYCLL